MIGPPPAEKKIPENKVEKPLEKVERTDKVERTEKFVAPSLPNKEGRQRSTFNLGDIGKVQKTAEEKPVVVPTERTPDKEINPEILKAAWDEFINLRKSKTDELPIIVLKRPYLLSEKTITVTITKGVEEMVFQTMRTSLITFLRDRTGNSSLIVDCKIEEEVAQERKAYTPKERFELIAEKNPLLKDLKDRFGLDPDLA